MWTCAHLREKKILGQQRVLVCSQSWLQGRGDQDDQDSIWLVQETGGLSLPLSIFLAPYIISNVFKEHNLNDGPYNSISGVLMTRAWFLWFMMSPEPIDGVVAP